MTLLHKLYTFFFIHRNSSRIPEKFEYVKSRILISREMKFIDTSESLHTILRKFSQKPRFERYAKPPRTQLAYRKQWRIDFFPHEPSWVVNPKASSCSDTCLRFESRLFHFRNDPFSSFPRGTVPIFDARRWGRC